MNVESRDVGWEGLCRVRHVMTGRYVTRPAGQSADVAGSADRLCLRLGGLADAVRLKRGMAVKLGEVWIALTGDRGIEIEPVEG